MQSNIKQAQNFETFGTLEILEIWKSGQQSPQKLEIQKSRIQKTEAQEI